MAKRPNLISFSWGSIRDVHYVGRYTIVEYTFTYANDCGDYYKGQQCIRFHCYVEEYSLGESADNLETAMLICIANRDGRKHNPVVPYVAKLLDL